MFKPWLPLHTVDAWELSFVLDVGLQVTSIEARGGMVVGGGTEVCVLGRGETLWWGHAPPPDEVGPVDLVAVEPRGARRHAIASAETLTVFVKGQETGEIRGLSSTILGSKITHIAWGGTASPSALYVLRDNHLLYQMKEDLSGLVALEIEPLHAIASDEHGAVAMVSLPADRPRVLLAPEGSRWHARALDAEVRPDASVEVAVAHTAVALVVDGKHVLLSRTPDAPFVRVPALDLGENEHGWRVGPIAFQGASHDAALLCARAEDDLARILRVDAAGEAMSLLEIAGTEIRDAPDIVSLSWDASRQTLWGVTSVAEVFRLTPPEAKGKRRVVLS